MSTTPSPEKPVGHGETRLAVAAILTASRFLAVYWSLQAFAFTPSMRLTWRAVIGLATALLLATLVRISEARARAGTPGFVRISWVLVAAVVGANLFLGWSRPLLLFAVVLVGIAATCRWLLRPSMETHPLVGFAVHAPIRILSIFYALVIFAADFGWEQLVPEGVLLIVGVWMADAAHDCATLPRDSATRARWAAVACALTSMIGGAAMLLVRQGVEARLAVRRGGGAGRDRDPERVRAAPVNVGGRAHAGAQRQRHLPGGTAGGPGGGAGHHVRGVLAGRGAVVHVLSAGQGA